MENEVKNGEAKKPNKFAKFLKAVFVNNIGWKILSLVSAFIMWALIAGLWS